MNHYVKLYGSICVLLLLVFYAYLQIKSNHEKTQRIYNSRIFKLLNLVKEEIIIQENNGIDIIKQIDNSDSEYLTVGMIFSDREIFLLNEYTLKELEQEEIMISSGEGRILIVAPGINSEFEYGNGDDLVLFFAKNEIKK